MGAWPKYVTVVLNRKDLDYIDEALEMLANYRNVKLADDLSQRLVTAWNEAEPLSPAQEIALTASRKHSERRKRETMKCLRFGIAVGVNT